MTRTPPSLKGTSVFSHRGCQCIHFRCHNSEQGIKTYSILNSLRSAWTSLASWYILLMYWMICRYSSRTLESDNWAFFSRGAGLEITKKKTKQKLSIFFSFIPAANDLIAEPDPFTPWVCQAIQDEQPLEPAGRAAKLCYMLAKDSEALFPTGAILDHATFT